MEKMKALLVDDSNQESVMILGDCQKPEPAAHELLVKIEATALNRADLMQKAGKYPPPKGVTPILGLEMAGIVEKVGKDVEGFEAGDSVFGLLPGGGYAEYCVIHAGHAMKIPDGISFEEAAGIAEVFLTAYQAVIWLGELAPKETVFIHAGASGVGTAAIQLARELKLARIITTAGSEEKCSLTAGLGADLCMNYKEENFADSLEETFGKNCVDVIIDFVGSPYWDKNMRILGMDGRLIYLAILGGAKVEKMSLVPILRKRLTVRGSTLRNRDDEYKTRLTKAFHNDAAELFKHNRMKPVIDTIFDWEDVEEAHSRMANNLNAGKIILTGM